MTVIFFLIFSSLPIFLSVSVYHLRRFHEPPSVPNFKNYPNCYCNDYLSKMIALLNAISVTTLGLIIQYVVSQGPFTDLCELVLC